MNVAKSNIFGIGVAEQDVLSLAASFSCRAGSFPFTYLGVPVGAKLHAKRSWDELICKVSNRLSMWKSKMISVGGRSTLIKSVINSLPTYLFSLLKAPASVIRDIDLVRRRFFWGWKDDGRTIHWIDWKFVISAKDSGGLGFGDLNAKNLSLLGKWLWRFKVEVNAPWRKCIAAIYGDEGGFHGPIIPSLRRTVWGGIIKALKEIDSLDVRMGNSFVKKVEDGCSTSFWKDRWNNLLEPLSVSFPRLFALEKIKDCVVADRWKLLNGCWVGVWDWRAPLRGRNYADFLALSARLNGLSLDSNRADRWVWVIAPNEKFSVKRLQKIIEAKSLSHQFQKVGKFPWNSWVPLKVNIGIWRMFHNRLATGDNLLRRGITDQQVRCCLCNDVLENLHHVLFECSKVRGVWKKLWGWWKVTGPPSSNVRSLVSNCVMGASSAYAKKAFKALEFFTAWAIWRWRNEICFAPDSLKVTARERDIFPLIQSMGFLSLKSRFKDFSCNWDSWISCPLSM